LDLNLHNKVALISASSQGLGKACALSLLQEGAKVVIVGRRPDVLAQAAHDLRQSITAGNGEVHTISGDVTKAEDIARIVKAAIGKFGRLDILVTNAGGPKPGDFSSLSEADWDQGLGTSLWPVIRLIRQCLPYLRDAKQRGGGRIVNIVSTSVKQPIEGLLLSNTIRPAVIGLAKTLSKELASDLILINNVCPGSFQTGRMESLIRSRAGASGRPIEEIMTESTKNIPLARFGDPSELGNLVAFLASERASYITGQTISVDGGLVVGLFG
jgi:3-oxoacyl-[acyl-carrier protein] reductase